MTMRVCAQCGAAAPKDGGAKLKVCSGCKGTPGPEPPRYCSRECQQQHWAAGHKAVCRKGQKGGAA